MRKATCLAFGLVAATAWGGGVAGQQHVLAQQIVSGVDADKNGQVGWQAGKGGLQRGRRT